jgi:hypothetical protein
MGVSAKTILGPYVFCKTHKVTITEKSGSVQIRSADNTTTFFGIENARSATTVALLSRSVTFLGNLTPSILAFCEKSWESVCKRLLTPLNWTMSVSIFGFQT